jgi:hypothetical protein
VELAGRNVSKSQQITQIYNGAPWAGHIGKCEPLIVRFSVSAARSQQTIGL